MIEYVSGNLLESEAEALVNAVNTVGVMGKGIALQFKKQFPHNYKVYHEACKKGTFKTGQVFMVNDGDSMNKKIIINFPTKAHWRGASKYEYIISGLHALRSAIETNNIKSIAVPALGCGNGGLKWDQVKLQIEEVLNGIDCHVYVYVPG